MLNARLQCACHGSIQILQKRTHVRRKRHAAKFLRHEHEHDHFNASRDQACQGESGSNQESAVEAEVTISIGSFRAIATVVWHNKYSTCRAIHFCASTIDASLGVHHRLKYMPLLYRKKNRQTDRAMRLLLMLWWGRWLLWLGSGVLVCQQG